MFSRFRSKTEAQKLHRHFFVSNFDTGILMIFIPLQTWAISNKMLSIAYVFVIPYFIDIVLDYWFSKINDRLNRKYLMILGNIMSGIVLCFYGLSKSVPILILLVTLKSIFSKLYTTSMDAAIRSINSKEEYFDFIAKNNLMANYGAAVGGQLFMTSFFIFKSYAHVFFAAGIIEICSTFFLFSLDHRMNRDQDSKQKILLVANIKNAITSFPIIISILFSAALAMFQNRMLIFTYKIYNIDIIFVGAILFIVYAVSAIVFYRIRKFVKKIRPLVTIMITSIIMIISNITIMLISDVYVFVLNWFIINLVLTISLTTLDDWYNKKTSVNLATNTSMMRICRVIATILGTFIFSTIIDQGYFRQSFMITVFVFFITVVTCFILLWVQKKRASAVAILQ